MHTTIGFLRWEQVFWCVIQRRSMQCRPNGQCDCTRSTAQPTTCPTFPRRHHLVWFVSLTWLTTACTSYYKFYLTNLCIKYWWFIAGEAVVPMIDFRGPDSFRKVLFFHGLTAPPQNEMFGICSTFHRCQIKTLSFLSLETSSSKRREHIRSVPRAVTGSQFLG